jgi:hypothetical protein
MVPAGEPPPAGGEIAQDGLDENADRALRELNKVFVRWLLGSEVPLFAACVLMSLNPHGPLGPSEVADEIGISVDDAARAMHELRTLGYAEENERRYDLTEAGLRLHDGLRKARLEAVQAFVGTLSRDELDALFEDLRSRQAS